MASSRVVNSSFAHHLVVGSARPAPPIKTATNIEDPEEESIRLAIALQLEDLENSYEPGMEEDGEAAVFEVYRSYLEESERFLADRRLAEELAAGAEPPELIIDDGFGGDTTNLEVRIKDVRRIRVTLDDDIDMVEMDMDEQMRLACELSLKMFEEEKHRAEKPTASSSAEARTVPVPQTVSTCSGCMEVFEASSVITPPCKHPYCAVCLKQFFINAVEDQASFPPRCCKFPIPLYLIYRRLSKQEVKQFREKVAEYTAKDRLYCSNRSCSAFIPFPSPKGGISSIQAEVVSCKACKRGTCVRCKAPEHAGDCPEDSELTATLTTAAKEGWQRCRDCRALVEKDYGCQHMSCLCGSEWCYRCAAKWKSCACGDFEIEGEVVPPRTVDDLIVKREDEAVLQKRREERELQRREAWASCDHGGKLSDKLRGRAKAREKGQKGTKKGKERAEESDCGNSSSTRDVPWWGEEGLWKYKLGESRCDICNVVLKDYIWSCEGCGLEACMACRENGL